MKVGVSMGLGRWPSVFLHSGVCFGEVSLGWFLHFVGFGSGEAGLGVVLC